MIIDALFFVTILLGFWSGFSRGIIKTVMYVFASIFGFIVAAKFTQSATEILKQLFNTDSALMPLFGFLTCLGLTIAAIQLLAKGLEGILQSTGINIINKVFGGIFLSAIFVLIYSVLLWFGDMSHILNEEQKKQSVTYPILEQYPGQVKQIWTRVSPNFKDFWDQTLHFIDEMEAQSKQPRDDGQPEIYDIDDDAPIDDDF